MRWGGRWKRLTLLHGIRGALNRLIQILRVLPDLLIALTLLL